MSKSSPNRKPQPATALELSRSGGSAVAVAAFLRSGAGKHGTQGRAAHRQDRRVARQTLRRGDWD
jgi:hypothetical protein